MADKQAYRYHTCMWCKIDWDKNEWARGNKDIYCRNCYNYAQRLKEEKVENSKIFN